MTLRVIAALRREGICKDPALIAAPLQQNETACRVLSHCIMETAEKLGVVHCISVCVGPAIPQATERQGVGNQIDAAMIFTRADFVNVL